MIQMAQHHVDTGPAFIRIINRGEKRLHAIVFDGQPYQGTYWYSVTEMFNNYQSDYYTFDGGWFAVKSSTGALVSFVDCDVVEGNLTIEDCKDEAFRIANQVIDVEQYELTATSDGLINTYFFQKYIDGCKTCAKLAVGISTSGKIVSFGYAMIDEIDLLVGQKHNDRISLLHE